MQALIGLQRQAIRINDAASSIAGIARTTTANTPTTSAENRESHRSAAAISYQMAPSPPLPYSNTRTTPHAQMPRGNAVQGDSEPSPMQSLPGFNGGYWMGDAKDVDADYHSFTSTLIPPGPPFPPQQPHQTSIKSNSPGPHSSPSSGSSWRRRLTKTRSLTTIAGSVKRSLSTPNVQQAAAVSATAAAAVAAAAAADSLPYSTDKRRNKLGYHRTSVACGTFCISVLWSRCFVEHSSLPGPR